MCEVKEPRIMLFGQTIQPHQHPPSSSHSLLRFITDEHESRDQNLSVPKQDHAKEEDLAKPLTSKESKDSSATGPILEDSNTPSADTNAGSLKAMKSEEDQNETSESQEKTLKKPDRILPCPRCNSMDTKFCYFNNYNVNQPRHFCKNCQRYWTAGGTMRNVPVGAGRRKNKNYVSQFHPALSHSGTVLTFGSDSPFSESMSSVLSIVDKTVGNGSRNGNGAMDSDGGKENRDDHSSSKDEGPYYPGGPWPYPWNSVQWNSSAFYSTMTPYWGCAMPGTWPVPWVFPRTQSSGPTLGKHSRDENCLNPADTDSEKSVWVLKTLRVDDSGEAEKSCISATLGIKKDIVDSIGGGGLFKAIESQSKSGEKARVQETSSVLQANPAALSRSLSFHESS